LSVLAYLSNQIDKQLVNVYGITIHRPWPTGRAAFEGTLQFPENAQALGRIVIGVEKIRCNK